MKLKDLLLIDNRGSFAFFSRFSFTKGQGYKNISKSYVRKPLSYNKLIDVYQNITKTYKDELKVAIISNIEDNKYDQSFERRHTEFFLRSSKYNSQSLSILKKSLNKYGDIGYLYLDKREFSLVNTDGRKEILEYDQLDEEFFKYIFKPFKKIRNSLYNYFDSNILPLPESIDDYYLSFRLSSLLAEYLQRKFDFSSINYLLIDSIWFKSGFLDKSALIEKFEDINFFNFDTTNVYTFLLNGALGEVNELSFLNSSCLEPDFQATRIPAGKIHVEENKVNKEIYLLEGLQNVLFATNGKIVEYDISFDNALYIRSAKKLLFKNRNKFKDWYTFYKYYPLNRLYNFAFSEEKKNKLVLDSNIYNTFKYNNTYKRKEIYDLDSYFKSLGKYKVQVLIGEKVKAGRVLAESQKLGGILYKELKAMADGVVKDIDLKKGKLMIEYFSEEGDRNRNFDDLKLKFVRNINKTKTLVETDGTSISSVINIGKDNIGILQELSEINNKENFNFPIALLVDSFDSDELKDKLKNTNISIFIFPSADRNELEDLFLDKLNKLSYTTIILLNGYGKRPYTSSQTKILKRSIGKVIVSDVEKQQSHILEKFGKFEISNQLNLSSHYSKIFNFQHWNLEGKLIYNDDDSIIFKTLDHQISDVDPMNILTIK